MSRSSISMCFSLKLTEILQTSGTLNELLVMDGTLILLLKRRVRWREKARGSGVEGCCTEDKKGSAVHESGNSIITALAVIPLV